MKLTKGKTVVINHKDGPILDPIPKRGEVARIQLSKKSWIIIEVWGSGNKITWGKIKESSIDDKETSKENPKSRRRNIRLRPVDCDN